MADLIEISLKQAAVKLADTQDVNAAASELGITASEVKHRIEVLETKLCLTLFTPESEPPALTEDGRFLIQAFREVLARRR